MLLLITSTKLITTNQSHQLLKDVLQYADQYYCKNSTTFQLLTRWILPLATKIITVPNDISHALYLLVTVKSKLFLPYSLQMMLCCCQKESNCGWGGGGRGQRRKCPDCFVSKMEVIHSGVMLMIHYSVLTILALNYCSSTLV